MFATNADGCDDTTSATIQAQTSGISELVKGVELYPNPTNGLVNLKNNQHAIGTIALYHSSGQIIFSEFIADSAYQLDLSNYQNGIYFLKTTHENGEQFNYRIVKQ